jgi:ankyrin repeat protein
MSLLPPSALETTALCWAARTGDAKLMKKLLENGSNVNLADYDQRYSSIHIPLSLLSGSRTPLHVAASEGNSDVVDILLQEGADIYKKDRWGFTPLECANNPTVLALLSQHANKKASDGNTLHTFDTK